MKKMAPVLLILALSLVVAVAVYAQQPKAQESADHAAMNSRGDQAMGFSHEKTTHHFRLFKNGGAIEVSANDRKDTDSRDMIRMHLAHIARMFAAGDFNTPMFIHDTTPPGTATMKELREQIHYRYHDTESGGVVRIETANTKALDAVHSFLRFQIAEHKTGDPSEIAEEAPSRR
jgi:hypothetical protein